MKPIPSSVRAFVLVSLALCCTPGSGGEPPRVLFLGTQLHESKPPKTVPAYVKQDSWHESLRASLEAALGPAGEKDLAAGGSGFRPAMVRLTTEGQPVRLEFRVAGLERLYFATLGRAADGSGSAQFLSPRLFDKQGQSVGLDLGGGMVDGKVDARLAGATEWKIGDTTHRGFALAPGEIAFKLDGQYERLEVLIGYPLRCGVPTNCASQAGQPGELPAGEVTMAETFKAAGYATAHVGKWHLGYTPETMPNAQGFDHSFGHMGGCIDNWSHFFYWGGPNIHDLHRNGTEVFADGRFFGSLMVEEAAEFMAANKDRPLFIYFAINEPHYPYQPDMKWLERFKGLPYPRKLYAAFLATLDERIGELLRHVDDLGLRERTVIVFQVEHGPRRV